MEYVRELNQLAHLEDATRATVSASNQDDALNFITDNIAWNRYDGWYSSIPATLAPFLDETHRTHPHAKIAISEYGAGTSIYHQQDTLLQTVPDSWWHPENWQTYYHIENWKILSQRPFVWGTFIWNMFDFGAAHRREGDRPGINDKGLVTHDRKVKKDAYYFYKANWNAEPTLHLAGKRVTEHTHEQTDVMVFSNLDEVTLVVNGKMIARQEPNAMKIEVFKGVNLAKGDNRIKVTGKCGKKKFSDSANWSMTPIS